MHRSSKELCSSPKRAIKYVTDNENTIENNSVESHKVKPQKLCLNTLNVITIDFHNAIITEEDRNANNQQSSSKNITTSPTFNQAIKKIIGGTISKANHNSHRDESSNSYNETRHRNSTNAIEVNNFKYDDNYMEFDFFAKDTSSNTSEQQFTELCHNFPVSYGTTNIVANKQTSKPPTPPPLSQLPTRSSLHHERKNNESFPSLLASVSCPSTPSRGKVVLSKKERKELNRLQKLKDSNNTGSVRSLIASITRDSNGTQSAQNSSPYKSRVMELKNCIARLNSKVLFRSSQKSLISSQRSIDQEQIPSNEVSPPPPAPLDQSPSSPNACNNNDLNYTEKLKNLPVRARKDHLTHLDNYCLFDPMDFVNEKTLRKMKINESNLFVEHLLNQNQMQLPNSLFHETVYNSQKTNEESNVSKDIFGPKKYDNYMNVENDIRKNQTFNYEHHNYFVIDPDEVEEEPSVDIGIPNPYTNDVIMKARLLAAQHTYVNNTEKNAKSSSSIQHLTKECEIESEFESLSEPMTNSQDSKDASTSTSTTGAMGTSVALLESCTMSTNSNSSTSSNSSLKESNQKFSCANLITLNLKKFENLPQTINEINEPVNALAKSQESTLSDLINSDHILHLQELLLLSQCTSTVTSGTISASKSTSLASTLTNSRNKANRSRTVPIESNYALFNPGPVPSRNLQYKVRKLRPLSTHSDADSGFLSPCSPLDEFTSVKMNPTVLILQQCDSVQGYVEIYTDWANYYLERTKSKKKVIDLSSDCRDGLLLSEIIEAVTSFKVPDLHKKPKNQQQMYDNVNSCLSILRSHAVAGLDNITANDICCGRLKAVLALFFALSRYKQQSKLITKVDIHQQPPPTNTTAIIANKTTAATTTGIATTILQNSNVIVVGNTQQSQQKQKQQQLENGNDTATMVNRQIPTAYSKANGTAIPLPATVMVQRRCPPDKVRPLPPTPNHTPSIPGLGKSGNEFNNSRPNSPPSSNHSTQSLKSANNNNGLRPPSIKTGLTTCLTNTTITNNTQNPATNNLQHVQQKHSMLDKFKLFNRDNKQQQQQHQQYHQTHTQTLNTNSKQQTTSKRTSSSSGFSSARSERSDSSLSLNDGQISQIKPPTVSVTNANSTNKGRDHKSQTKQSKLLAAQNKKDILKNSTKMEKKEKSPARSIHRDETTNIDNKNSTLSRTKQTINKTNEKKTKFDNNKTNLHNKNEGKSSLNVSNNKTSLTSSNNSSLPKPIAAIKGTSKLPQPPQTTLESNKTRMTNSNSQQNLQNNKREKCHDISNETNNISIQQQHQQQQQQININQPPTHIVKPVPIMPDMSNMKTHFYSNASMIALNNNNDNNNNNNHIVVENSTMLRSGTPATIATVTTSAHDALYSRLPPPKLGFPSSTPANGRKFEYNPSFSVLSSPGLRNPTTTTQSQPVTPTTHISPNQQFLNNSNTTTKFHTIPSKIVPTIYEEDKPINVVPMRPLLRGYNSHVTLPTRGIKNAQQQQQQHHQQQQRHFLNDFTDTDIHQQGYCSDGGELLRFSSNRLGHNSSSTFTNHNHNRFHDLDNGYLSEGSSSSGGISFSHNSHGLHSNTHGKHFLSFMRARTQLPTTIEERIRNSHGSLDSIGTTVPGCSSVASQASSSGGSNTKMDSGNNGSGGNINTNNNSAHNSPQHYQFNHHNNSHRSSLGGRNFNSNSNRDNWSKMPESNKVTEQIKSSPSRRSSSGGSGSTSSISNNTNSKQGSPSGRTKGVPPSFGYVKRSNGASTATAEQQNIVLMLNSANNQPLNGRTAHVSAVPRSLIDCVGTGVNSNAHKISGGTQTLPNDITRVPPHTQHRSYSLTGPGATQLSQSIRERLSTGSHSLPKPANDIYHHRITNRSGKLLDGSLSDTQTYAEVKPEYSSYAMWLKHSNTAGSRLSEGATLEAATAAAVGVSTTTTAMQHMSSNSPAMVRHNHKLMQQRAAVAAATAAANSGGGGESSYVQSPRMNRSNSIRSTKSEKMYPSMLSRGPDLDIEPYYCLPVGANTAAQMAATGGHNTLNNTTAVAMAWSQPTSPTPINRGYIGTMSPSHANTIVGINNITNITTVTAGTVGTAGSMTSGGTHKLTYPKKNDEVHGSAASLLSGGSSLYGTSEERQAHEIRRLKRELIEAREQVLSLSSQLSTNAHVVAAFEQSLSNMTTRLQQLTATAERKDGELTDMRQTIELLRKQSIQAGLTTAHMQSMGVQTQSQSQNDLLSNKLPPLPTSSRSQLQQHVTTGNGHANTLQRHHSSDSMCSVNSISSGCSTQDKKKKKGWLRSSFTKAFSRNAKISKTSRGVQQHHHSLNGPNTLSNNTNQGSDTNHSINGTPIINRNNHHNNNNQHHDIHQTHHQRGEPPGLAALATQPTILCSPTKLNINNSNSNTKSVTLIDNAKPIDAIDHEDNNNQQIVEDLKKQLREKDLVLTDIRLEALSSASQLESLKETVNKMRAEMMSLKQNNERLQKLVTSRSLAGSEASLGNAISPNSPIGSEASRRYSLADGNTRPPMELPKRLDEEVEEENVPPAPAPEPPPTLPLSPSTHIDLTPPPPALEPLTNSAHLNAATHDIPDINDGKKIAIAVYLGQPESFQKYCEELMEADEYFTNGTLLNNVMIENSIERKTFSMPGPNEFIIAYTYISGKTTWQNLDYIVRKTFKDYVSRIDPGTNLGLNTDSITSYHLGEAKRGPEMGFPELLPCGYIIGNVKTLYICLQGVGSLAFDSLIPRSIVHRYISLLTEHRRLILCGPSGTGKSYLARRLAEFLVARIGNKSNSPSEAIATFNVDHKSSKELRQYLSHIAEQAAIANRESELPSVIILDNLHHASALGDVFSCLLSAGPAAKLPCIIGTMSQATCNTTNLQLHHNFRWVLTANHMEPVKGFLGRFLRRRLFQLELQAQHTQPELATVLAWLPTVWQHINRFLEAHSSSDVTIGPRLFLSCPLDLKESQVWFTDIWNYHLSPYLIEAVREGVQLYGRRGGAWNDPSAFIRNSYPWPYGPDSVPPLRQINAEDVGLEGVPSNNSENQDPLLNMLMRLQEAANYSENPDPESDCASLDSNVTPDSSAGAE